MKSKYLIAIVVLLIIIVAAITIFFMNNQKIDLKSKCCAECKNVVNAMFTEQPQIAMSPDAVNCGMFKGGNRELTTECTSYFEKNKVIVSECK